MADALNNVTTAYALATSAATAIKSNTTNSPHRRLIIISNLDAQNGVMIAFGATASATVGHLLPAGQTWVLGGYANFHDTAGPPVPNGTISAIAVAGTPNIAVTICG